MRHFGTILLVLLLSSTAVAQPLAGGGACVDGQCPLQAAPAAQSAADLRVDARAIARIVNQRGAVRSAGTGTLVDVDSDGGLVITCAHLFREGTGAVSVTFPDQATLAAKVEKIDADADLAALSIPTTTIEPVTVATAYPRRGDSLVSCGYGGDGRLWCNRGQALGYVATGGGQNLETLELSGAARFGDSGGPVLDRDHQLVAVLFGTNGRVVDGTYCGRVRRFLSGLSRRFRPAEPPATTAERPPTPGLMPPNLPAKPAPPATPQPDRLADLERLIARIQQAWQAMNTRVDALATATADAQKAASAAKDAADGAASGAAQTVPPAPPTIDAPIGSPPADMIGSEIEKVAEPWISAKLAALLVSVGVPGGIAGVAAGAVVWLVMRRARQRLQGELDRVKSTGADAAAPSGDSADSAVRHHNQYVAYETSALDKAWAAAHAHVGERYPGAVPYLKLVEGVKDQLISGNNDPQLS